MNTYSFLITSLIIIIIPGTGVIYTISTGLTSGKKISLFAALGCTMGILPHLCVSIALSSLLMKMSKEAFTILKLLGTVYLLYLGAGMLLSRRSFELSNDQLEEKSSTIILRGIFINLLNPKLTLFFFSFLPQYVSFNGKNYIFESLLYGFAFMFLTFIVFIGYGVLAGTAKKVLVGYPKRMDLVQKFFGIIFILFAIQLLLSSI